MGWDVRAVFRTDSRARPPVLGTPVRLLVLGSSGINPDAQHWRAGSGQGPIILVTALGPPEEGIHHKKKKNRVSLLSVSITVLPPPEAASAAEGLESHHMCCSLDARPIRVTLLSSPPPTFRGRGDSFSLSAIVLSFLKAKLVETFFSFHFSPDAFPFSSTPLSFT